MSLLNWGGGLSAMGGAISEVAGSAGLAVQKADLEKQQAVLADQLATTRETALTHVRGEEDRTTGAANAVAQGDQSVRVGAANATAQGEQQRATDTHKNTLPITASEKATLEETLNLHEREGWETLQDSDGNTYRVNSGRGISQKRDQSGNWIDQPSIPSNLNKIGAPSQATFTPEMSDLMGALAERGVSLPAGLRSRQQQMALYKGILDRNPGMSGDEIADQIKAGKLQLVADTKQAQTVGGITGKIKYAEEEMPLALQTARDALGKVPTSSFLPLSKLIGMADQDISDPNLRDLKIKLVTALNAYDMLAARGGTDAKKREETHALMMSADTPEVLNKAIDAFELEATNAKIAAKRAMTFDAKNGPKADNNTAKPTDSPNKALEVPASSIPKAAPGTILGKTPDGRNVIAGPDGTPHVEDQ